MKLGSISFTYENGDSLTLTEAGRGNHLFCLLIRSVSRKLLTAEATDFPKHCTRLGANIVAKECHQTEPYQQTWELQLSRSPNATQWAAFMELLFKKIHTRAVQVEPA